MNKSEGDKQKELEEILYQLRKVYKTTKQTQPRQVIKSKLIPNLQFKIANCI